MTADLDENSPVTPHSQSDIQATTTAPSHSRRKHARVVVWCLLLLALVAAFVLVLRHHEDARKAAPRPPGITVTTATAQKGDIGVYLDAIGTVTPVYTDSITSQVNGLVVAVHYTEGQRVRKGDPLIDIDPRPYQATLLQAKGRWNEIKMCSPKREWTLSVTAPHGRATPSPSRSWTTRKKLCCRTKGP